LLSHPGADLSTEPDGTFVSWAALETGRIRLVEAEGNGDFVELEGTPDMVLEVVSSSSVRKDTVELRDRYWRAGIAEYWLVDARSSSVRFEILRHEREGYAAVEAQDGWLASTVFGHMFQLGQQSDRLGHPLFTLSVR
jgi:Uma2 family endonuclease